MVTMLIGSEQVRYEIKRRLLRGGSNVWKITRALNEGDQYYHDAKREWIATFASGIDALEYIKRQSTADQQAMGPRPYNIADVQMKGFGSHTDHGS